MEETHEEEGIMTNELLCLNCGKGFTPTCHITRQKFCSSECRVRYNNAKRYYTDTPVNECPEYGTPIQQSGEAGRWRRFCGKRCRQLYHYKKWLEKRQANYQPPVQICPNCGKDFQPEWGPGTQRRSAGTSAGQRERIGQSAGADHALLLDRASISRQNGYVEPDGTIRLYFTLEQAQTKLHCSRQSATRIFRELEYSGLIVRRKQGLGKPALITLNYPADAKLIAKEGEDA